MVLKYVIKLKSITFRASVLVVENCMLLSLQLLKTVCKDVLMRFNYLSFSFRRVISLACLQVFVLLIGCSIRSFAVDSCNSELAPFTTATAIEYVNTLGATQIPGIDIVSKLDEELITRRRKPKACGLQAIFNRLEATTLAFVKSINASGAPGIQCLLPDAARLTFDQIQNIPVPRCPTTIEDVTITVCDRPVVLNIVRPINSTGPLPIIMYFHGGGWELGNQFTFDRLIRQLSSGTNAALVFVNYTRTPEAVFPVANEQAYAATQYIVEHAAELNLDASRLALAGDSVGGNMAINVAMKAKQCNGPSIIQMVLFYPVTQACFDTPSYLKFAECLWLTRVGMMHFWNFYEPNVAARNNPQLSPLRATLKDLRGLPSTLLITAQNDVLRSDGEWFAKRLRCAGVPVRGVRFLGTIHDFVMLNPLASTPATIGAICLAQATLRKAFGT